MEITRHSAGHLLTLSLKGRLDGSWSEHTSEAFLATLEEGWHHLRLDLSEVSFLSSAGIRTLIQHYKKLATLKGSLVVINPSRPVRDILTMAGLQMLLTEAPTPESGSAASRTLEGGSVESYTMTPGATLQAALLDSSAPLCFPAGMLGLGLGTLGSEPGIPGEFFAMAGTAIAQPADGRQSPDYVTTQGELRPGVAPRTGIAARGSFALCLRFDTAAPQRGLPLSALIDLALKETGADAVGLAFAAEAESLVGAALLRAGENQPLTPLPFPEVRNQMAFTAEPAWPRSLALGVAFAARSPDHPLAPQLRPLGPLRVHAHAAAFPYSPLPKGELCPEAFTAELLESEQPLGLLHLLDDHRPGGLGESRFHRGALWVAPLETIHTLQA